MVTAGSIGVVSASAGYGAVELEGDAVIPDEAPSSG
jgi:hypothetical protein